MERFDVVIVGAGLAGLFAARSLACRGLRVLLVDRKQSLSAGVHTTGIFVRRTLEAYADVLRDELLGPSIRDVTLYSPARRALALSSPHAEFRIGEMGAIYTTMLAEAEGAGVEFAGATAFLGADFAGDAIAGDGVAGGVWRVRLAGTVPRQVQARFLIGADGARSRVASHLGLDENRRWIVGVEDVYRDGAAARPVRGAPAIAPRLHCFLDPRLAPGYIAWLTRDGRSVHVGLAGYAARFRPAAALERFSTSLATLVDLDRLTFIERRGGRIPVGGILRRIASPRGLLIGDAAGAVSPLSAGGLDPCFRLTELAVEVTRRWLIEGDASALAAYNGNRFRRKFWARSWARRGLAAIRAPWMLEAACWALRHTPLGGVARQIFFGRGSFPDIERRPATRPTVAKPISPTCG